MTFELSKSQKSIQKAAREFARGEFAQEIALDLDRNGRFPEKIHEKAADLGFIGIALPEQYGGGAMSMMEQVLVAETLSQRDPTLGAAVTLSALGATALASFGTTEQKERLLPQILEGKYLSGIANPFLPMTIELETASLLPPWQASGEANHILNGMAAGLCFLPLKSEAGGEAVALLEPGHTGVALAADSSAFGLRMTPRARLTLDRTGIGPENLLGGEKGISTGPTELIRAELRILMAALSLGTAQGAFDRALVHVRQRKQFGRSIGQFQVVRHKLVEMETRIQAARLFTYLAATSFKPRKPDAKGIAQAALVSADAAVDVSSDAIQLLGGYGYTTEYEVERCYRDAKTIQLLCGHSSDMKDEIAASLMGKLQRPKH